MKLVIVIPTYNEEKIISSTIKKTLGKIQELPIDSELVISDDASKDNTIKIVKALIQEHDNLKLITHSTNGGRGEAVSDAFLKCDGDVFMFMDADLSTDLKHINNILTYVGKYDVIIGSRWLAGSNSYRSLFRIFTSLFYNTVVRLLFRTGIKDHECGFKAFRKETAKQLVNKVGVLKHNVRGVAWDTEVLVRAKKMGYKIKEFPVKWYEGEKSEINITNEGIKTLKYLLGLRIKLWKEKD